jgi:hypothetical membrane protein
VTWAARLGLTRDEIPTFAAGAFAILLTIAASTKIGEPLSLALLVALGIFALVVLSFIAAPHISVAVMIPIFVLLPAIKILLVPWIGPLKDVIGLAAIAAGATIVVQRASAGQRKPGDMWVTILVGFLMALYILNMGGGLEHDLAWMHGVRLFSEPLLLLLVGLTLSNPKRTFDWAMASLIATSCFAALIGIFEQAIGHQRLHSWGFEYDIQIRFLSNFMRSFGTLDNPFGYAGFLMFGVAAVLLWMRRGLWASIAASIIVVGVTFSFVRSALLMGVALVALWLARTGRLVTAGFLTALVLVSGAFLVASEQAMKTRTVRGGDSVYITVNGRTEAWKVVFDNPWDLPLGKGVGEFGTAAERATFTISRSADEARANDNIDIDSGYFATIADVGLVGLTVLLLLNARLAILAGRAARRGSTPGWVVLGLLAVFLIDSITRESFSAFPTAFLGLLFVGLALAAAAEETATPPRTAPAG